MPDIANREIFLCGPVPWIAAVHHALRRTGGKRNQIHTEGFAW